MLKNPYVSITKPGIIFGNLISVAGGFFLASQGSVDGMLFLATVIGIALVIASGCVFNNYIDRDIDRLMERTQGRVTVQGLISPGITLAYGSVLGIVGFLTLVLGTNALATLFALLGFVVYVGLYSLYLKRHSVYGTLVGSLSGAAPPVVGYCAVSGQFDLGALTLLLIFCLWQMPHSYAIAIFRYQDYRAASIPVLPVTHGVRAAKHYIFWYILAFLGATLMLTLAGYAGYGYFAVAAAMGLYWLVMALRGYRTGDDRVWAKKVFIFSIFTITALSIMMSIDFQVTDTEVLMTSLR
ncbi:heme o synthase [Chromohalobacter nigrandesensis]|uniref:heme o synthase n=1 Tax=Chromohalobacter nigrandesensis TaxID=119863 RepID=UPI001FF4DE1B|nr:heme o synthase [Chromohalobacter nigrandesensis]MCK0744378.1 heme o synthase [Chromohalobacter nigrandesensis]